jgi:hypothetical protein
MATAVILIDGQALLVEGDPREVAKRLSAGAPPTSEDFVELADASGEPVFVKPDHVAGVRPE